MKRLFLLILTTTLLYTNIEYNHVWCTPIFKIQIYNNISHVSTNMTGCESQKLSYWEAVEPNTVCTAGSVFKTDYG